MLQKRTNYLYYTKVLNEKMIKDRPLHQALYCTNFSNMAFNLNVPSVPDLSDDSDEHNKCKRKRKKYEYR